MQDAYDDDRETVALPGTDNTITGVAINEWLDDDGDPKFGKDEEQKDDKQPEDDKQQKDAGRAAGPREEPGAGFPREPRTVRPLGTLRGGSGRLTCCGRRSLGCGCRRWGFAGCRRSCAGIRSG